MPGSFPIEGCCTGPLEHHYYSNPWPLQSILSAMSVSVGVAGDRRMTSQASTRHPPLFEPCAASHGSGNQPGRRASVAALVRLPPPLLARIWRTCTATVLDGGGMRPVLDLSPREGYTGIRPRCRSSAIEMGEGSILTLQVGSFTAGCGV